MGDFIDPADLERALSTPTYVELYAPPDSATVDLATVQQDIESAEGLVISFLIGFYDFPLVLAPETDRLVRAAALMFARAFAFMHHPEYVRTFGDVGNLSMYKEGTALMQRVQAAKQRLPDASKAQTPKNVGGFVAPPGPILIGDKPGDF